MGKPQKQTISYYDYLECSRYLEEKHGYKERDYAGHFEGNPDAPYQDFWHFVCDKRDVHNDGILTLPEWIGEDAEDWQKTILGYYLDEFGEVDESGDRAATFWISW